MRRYLMSFILVISFLGCSNEPDKKHDSLDSLRDCSKYSSEAERMYNARDYKGLLTIPYDALSCDTSVKIKVMMYKAMSLLELKRFPESIQMFDSLIKIHPWDAPLYGKRGLCFDNMKNYSEAMKDYTKALDINPRLSMERNNRGFIYNSMGDTVAAKLDYDYIIADDPSYFLAYNNRGMLYQETGKNELAIKDFEKALAIHPDALVLYNLSTSQYADGDFHEALISSDKAISINSKDARFYRNRAYIKVKLNDMSGACSDFQVAQSMGFDVSDEISKCCK